MSKNLTEADVIAAFNEEWERRINSLLEKVDVTLDAKIDGDVKDVITPELKVIHKQSGIRYTVDSVGKRDIMLRTPEGDTFLLDKEEFEKDYEL